MLPKTTTTKIEGRIFFMKHTNLLVNVEEAKEIARALTEANLNPNIDAIIVDNTEAVGVWRQEVNEVWEETTNKMMNSPKKSITLTNSAIATIQMNRLARKFGITDRFIAHQGKMTDELWAFLKS